MFDRKNAFKHINVKWLKVKFKMEVCKIAINVALGKDSHVDDDNIKFLMELIFKETAAGVARINVKHAACPTTPFRQKCKTVFVESIDLKLSRKTDKNLLKLLKRRAKTMKKIITVSLFVVIIIFTIRTASSQDSPDIVVGKYLISVRANDYEKAYTFISKSDNTIIEWLEQLRYIRQIAPPQLIAIIDIAHSASKQEIVKTTVEGDNAIVEIHSLVPDMGETLKITNRVDEIKSILDQDILPMRMKEGIFELILEVDMWKISRMRGVTADQAAEIASNLAEQILGKEEAEKLSRKIKEFRFKLAEEA